MSNKQNRNIIPLLIDFLSKEELESYRQRIIREIPEHFIDNPHYEIIYKITDDRPADYIRAIQESEILKTRIKTKNRNTGRTISLRSFAEIWSDPASNLAKEILESADPLEAKWRLSTKYNYKLATTFMPMYAKSIYEYFGSKTVLDPCAGWGDRMTGALASTCVNRYVGFDPNVNLVPGYKKIQQDFGNKVETETTTHSHSFSNETPLGESSNSHAFTSVMPSLRNCPHLVFSGGHEIYSLPFETGERLLRGEKFDLVFTSPPFFDYEEYTPENPKYKNWYKEFYEPLFIKSETHLIEGGYFAIHIDDTSAGKIRDFLFNTVAQITSFQFCGKIGLVGGHSGKVRNVYLFKKI